jgi:pyruvate/2-oxoglutarate/acetoin dehydrogenase E1 component
MSSATTVTMIQALNAALADAMEEDSKVVLIGEDIADPERGGITGVTRGLSTRFGDQRVRSTPISEQAIVGAAIGASMAGYKVVAEIMLMNFTAVAMDMIVNHAAKLRFMSGGQTGVPIVIRMMTGAGFGMPTYYSPRGPAPRRGERIPLGKARVSREGTDATIVSYARTAAESLAAAEALAQEGISVEVVDLRTISPWDKETVLASAAKTGRVLVAHESVRNFGPGGEIAATVAEALFGRLKAPVRRIGAPTSPVPFSQPLEAAFLVARPQIEAAVRELVKGEPNIQNRLVQA